MFVLTYQLPCCKQERTSPENSFLLASKDPEAVTLFEEGKSQARWSRAKNRKSTSIWLISLVKLSTVCQEVLYVLGASSSTSWPLSFLHRRQSLDSRGAHRQNRCMSGSQAA